MTVIKGLLIYAAAVGLLVGGISAGMDLPYDKALGMYAIGVIGVLSIAVPVLVVRLKPKRQPRQKWQHLGCDPVAPRLPAPAPRYRIEAPIAKEIDHVTVDFPRISSTPVRLLSAPPNHRDGRTAD